MTKVILTKYQSEIVSGMEASELYLWTNEGNNLRAWLGDESAKVVKNVRVKSAESLLTKGVIKFSPGDYPLYKYRYELAKEGR